ncbi:MMPL family transporter [Glycomyces algeriensis]|uniref:Membrane protein n=1 Tax=Glycomyces algeriensis TaxID=256037 RepID=A0A9W6LH30_9ACTN|nr:MMPL family transporter [Glycomyces algeriensis]MDA1367441.1 MMPL family transporter [Glycomyces algeriensis]MDR7350904.1 RND superfamily putative drug exporter [Glycomyces algeriensis]GLI43617.1 membrane protein [Glycomyces algeriensis]
MATFLYRLGRGSYRLRWLVLAVWILIVGGVGAAAATMQQETNPEFVLPGTESQEAFDLLEDRFPDANADGGTAQIVFESENGEPLTAEANKAVIDDLAATMADSPQIASVTSPFATDEAGNPIGMIAADGQTIAVMQVAYAEPAMELDEGTIAYLEDAIADTEDAGVRVEVGGDVLQPMPETGTTELIGIGVALVVLVITFGALLAAGLPIITAVLGVMLTTAGILAATSFMNVSESTGTLASMIGLAVGIDYALFILSRYRNELAADGRVEDKRARAEAMGRAVGTAGSAVFFAGLTVVIALLGLSVVNIPFLTEMAVAAAVTVVIAVLIAVTLLPAFAGFTGKRIFTKRQRRRIAEGLHDAKPNGGKRWAGFITRHPILVALVGIVGLGTLAYPALDLELGLPDAGTSGTETTQRQAYDLISEGFGAGFNGQLIIVGDLEDGVDAMTAAQDITAELNDIDGIAVVGQAFPNADLDTVMVTVIPETGPSDHATNELVHEIRGFLADDTDANWAVTGATALNIDISDNLNDALLPYMLIVVGLAALILLLVFRSILVPIMATLGFMLSVFAALGALVAVFQWGWGAELFNVDQPGPIMSMMPILMIGLVFGLAMDYQIFLVTRVREAYVHGADPKRAIVEGYGHSSRVVVAAALIMISVFAAFIFSGEALIASMGFALAAAVIFDAFVVRMAIIPAIMALIGRGSWWIPKWLDRILPNVDVEGDKLQEHLTKDAPSEDERELVGASK